MNLIRYVIDFFHINGAGQQSVKYAKGQTYPESDETMSHVEAGHAEIVVVEVSTTTETSVADTAPQPDGNAEPSSLTPAANAPVQNEVAPVTTTDTDTPAAADATATPDTTAATATVSQTQPDLTQTPPATDPAPVAAPSADTTSTEPAAQAPEPVPPVAATPVDQQAQVVTPAEAAPMVDTTPPATAAAPAQAGQN